MTLVQEIGHHFTVINVGLTGKLYFVMILLSVSVEKKDSDEKVDPMV